MFGDKNATIQRFKEVYTTRLSDDIKARLVLENDEVRPGFDFSRNKPVTRAFVADVLQRRRPPSYM